MLCQRVLSASASACLPLVLALLPTGSASAATITVKNCNDTGADSLFVANAADSAEAFYISFAPDGKTLYYLARSAHGWSIRSKPMAGGTSRLLVDFDDPARQHTRYGFATDGKRFYFTLGSPESDIWVADLTHP